MNRTPILLISLAIVMLILSCNSKEKKEISYNKSVTAIDTINIVFPDTIPNIINATKKHLSGEKISFISGSEEVSLYTYDLLNKKWELRCLSCIDEYPIKYRGPFSFLNDSIILYFHSYKKEILFINYIKNKVIKSIKLKDNLTFSSYDDIQINFKDSVLRMPAMSNQYIDNDYFNNSFVGLDVDLSKDSIKKRFNYPSNSGLTANHEFSLLKPEAIFLENKVVLNFQSLDKLYVFHDSINAYIEYINPGQNIINNKQYVFNEDMDIERKLLIEFSGLYKRLIYDDLKDLYYRIMITYPDFDGRIPSSREKLNRIIASRKTTVSVMNGGFKEIACNSISGVSDFMCFASDGKLYMLEDDKVNTDDLESFIGFDLTDL